MHELCLSGCWCCVQALFCQVPPHHVLTLHDVSNIWQVSLFAVGAFSVTSPAPMNRFAPHTA